jgi:hypothetical protein
MKKYFKWKFWFNLDKYLNKCYNLVNKLKITSQKNYFCGIIKK